MRRKNFDLILKRIKNPKISETYTTHLMSLVDRLNDYSEIWSLIESNHLSIEVVNNARKNFLINLVSYFETWMKRLFLSIIDKYNYNIDKIAEAIREKVKFQDLIKTLKSPVSIGQLTAEFINFQDIDKINKFYSTLFDESFFEEILDINKTSMKPLPSDFYLILKNGIEIRHELIHNFITNLQIEKNWLEQFDDVIISFTMSAMGYCNIKLKEHLGYNPDKLMEYLLIIGELDDDEFLEHISYVKKELSNINEDEESLEKIMKYIEKNEPENLIDFLKNYLDKNQDDITAILYLANLYLHYDKTKDSEELLKKALLIGPSFSQVWQFYFEESLLNNELENGLSFIQRALTFNPESSRSWFSLSILHLILNEQDRFKKYLFKAFKNISDKETDLMFFARDFIIFKEKYHDLEKLKEIIQNEIESEYSSDLLKIIYKIEKKYIIRSKEKKEWGYIRFI